MLNGSGASTSQTTPNVGLTEVPSGFRTSLPVVSTLSDNPAVGLGSANMGAVPNGDFTLDSPEQALGADVGTHLANGSKAEEPSNADEHVGEETAVDDDSVFVAQTVSSLARRSSTTTC